MKSAFILSTLSPDLLQFMFDKPIVVIGENAVCLWVHHFGLHCPALMGSSTIEFFANFADIDAVDALLCHHPHSTTYNQISNDEGLPVLFGSIQVDTKSGGLTMEFIGDVLGVTLSNIQMHALPCALAKSEKPRLRVMHPMMCLEHWITRLALSHKEKNPHLADCARVSVAVVRAYIEQCVAQKDMSTAMEAMQRVLALADSEAGQRVWHLHGVDVSSAVPALTLLADNC